MRNARSVSRGTGSPGQAEPARTLGIGAVLAICLAWSRAAALVCSGTSCDESSLHQSLWGTIADLAYATVLTALVSIAAIGARHRPGFARAIRAALVTIVAASILAAWANPLALRDLGQPISYQWLYYSDFLLSLDAYNSLYSLLSWSFVLHTALAFLATLILGAAVGRRLFQRRAAASSRRTLAVLALVALPALLATWWLHSAARPNWKKRANPVVFFLRSTLGAQQAPVFARATSSIGPDDFLSAEERSPASKASSFAVPPPRSPAVRNVLLIVLESVGAQTVGLHGASPSATPELDAYRDHARIYSRAYAHVPSTMHTLVSLLSSAYHPHSFRILTRESPRVPLPAISDALKRRGYRTAFFNSADNRFQRGEEFLQSRAFDAIVDHRAIPCARGMLRAKQKDWPLLDGVYDDCAGSALFDWIQKASGQPFFAVLWTMQTHYPYFASAERTLAPDKPRLNRYLSGLHETDQAVGKLLRDLDARHLLDSTLVVVLGDHGEGLGKHWHFVHSTLYEEDAHIPLVLINRTLFRGEVDSTTMGIVDIAPTIMDLLGLPPEPSWQGRSAFDPNRSGRVYLFAPFAGVLFGFVEDSRKFIYDAGADTWELYDLRADPAELENLAGTVPDLTAQRNRLVSWFQYQRTYYRRALTTPLY